MVIHHSQLGILAISVVSPDQWYQSFFCNLCLCRGLGVLSSALFVQYHSLRERLCFLAITLSCDPYPSWWSWAPVVASIGGQRHQGAPVSPHFPSASCSPPSARQTWSAACSRGVLPPLPPSQLSFSTTLVFHLNLLHFKRLSVKL